MLLMLARLAQPVHTQTLRIHLHAFSALPTSIPTRVVLRAKMFVEGVLKTRFRRQAATLALIVSADEDIPDQTVLAAQCVRLALSKTGLAAPLATYADRDCIFRRQLPPLALDVRLATAL